MKYVMAGVVVGFVFTYVPCYIMRCIWKHRCD